MRKKATDEPTQKSRPKKGEPIDIPIPSEEQVARDFLKVALAGRTNDNEAETDLTVPDSDDSETT